MTIKQACIQCLPLRLSFPGPAGAPGLPPPAHGPFALPAPQSAGAPWTKPLAALPPTLRAAAHLPGPCLEAACSPPLARPPPDAPHKVLKQRGTPSEEQQHANCRLHAAPPERSLSLVQTTSLPSPLPGLHTPVAEERASPKEPSRTSPRAPFSSELFPHSPAVSRAYL